MTEIRACSGRERREMREKRLRGAAGSFQGWWTCSLSWLWDGFTAVSMYQNASDCIFDTCSLLHVNYTLIKEHHFPFSFLWGKDLDKIWVSQPAYHVKLPALHCKSRGGLPIALLNYPAWWVTLQSAVWALLEGWALFSVQRNLISGSPAVRSGWMALP